MPRYNVKVNHPIWGEDKYLVEALDEADAASKAVELVKESHLHEYKPQYYVAIATLATPMSQEEFIRRGPSICVYCESGNTDYGRHEASSCYDCKARWEPLYELVGYKLHPDRREL